MNVAEAKAKIANPLIKVEPFDGPRGGHWYRAFSTITGEQIAAFPSVTGQLDIIGGGKTHGLMWWAKRQAIGEILRLLGEEARVKGHHLEAFNNELAQRVWDKQDIEPGWIDLCIKMALRQDKKVLKDAGDIGTRVHHMIDAHINGITLDPTDISEDAKIGFNNFMRFVFENDIEFVQGDTPVISLKYKYGGRLDGIAIIKNELVLLDWKTGNAIRDDAACQTAAYNLAMAETLGIKAKRCIVCRFDKTAAGFFEHKEVKLAGAEKAWLHAHKLHSAYNAKLLWRENGTLETKGKESDVPAK